MSTVAIIGAGVAGLTAIKACLEEGLKPFCFEQYEHIGGLWMYSDDVKENQGASVYESLITNVSKESTNFSDFPFPQDFPPYCTSQRMLQYLQAYAKHFDLLRHIRFNSRITKIEESPSYATSGSWTIHYTDHDSDSQDGIRQTFDSVIVCSGFYHAPIMPDIPGLEQFEGTLFHSLKYRRMETFKDKNVLVIGNAHSAGDIAVDASRVAKQVYLSVGNGTWVLPRLSKGGLPIDLSLTRLAFMVPVSIRNLIVGLKMHARLDHENYGLQSKNIPGNSPIMVNDEIGLRIMAGRIVVKPTVVNVSGRSIELDTGEVLEDVETLVCATGYDMKCDFLQDSVLKGSSEDYQLYRQVWPIHHPHHTLATVGMTRVNGAALPVMEMQSRWVARVLSAGCTLPQHSHMEAWVNKRNAVLKTDKWRTVLSMDPLAYRDEMAKEIGVQPSFMQLLFTDPKLAFNFLAGPASSCHHRLVGPHAWPGARSAALATFSNTITSTKTRVVRARKWYTMFIYEMISAFVISGVIGIIFIMTFSD